MGEGLLEDSVEGGARRVSECDGYFDSGVNVSVNLLENVSVLGTEKCKTYPISSAIEPPVSGHGVLVETVSNDPHGN